MRVKLVAMIIFISILHVSAATMGQKLTLSKKNVSIAELFREIRKQTGYTVLWETDQLDASRKINLGFREAELEKVLEVVLSKEEFTYTVEDKNILIQRKAEKGVLEKFSAYLALIEVKGKVVDENGAPLGGASVVVKSNGKGVSTAVDGTFTLSGVKEGEVLVVKFIGFDAKEVKAERNMGTIRLKAATNELDAVQVQAYGTTSKRLSVSNIVSVRAKDIENQVVDNPLLALKGRVPGVQITQMSGNSGASIQVRIQGTSSLMGGLDPFYVVDGIPYNSTTIRFAGNGEVWGSADSRINGRLQLVGSGSPLSYINPYDIESIEVLKDADATAIYGSRAANGAILITTKKGKPGAVKVDLNLNSGWNRVPQRLELLNTEQYLEIRNEAFRNFNVKPEFYDYDVNGFWGNGYTDWQEVFLGQSRNYSKAELGISGGTVNTNYRINLTASHQPNPFEGDFRNNSVALSSSLNTASANQKFKLTMVANYLKGDNTLPSTNFMDDLIALPPNAPALYHPDGSINWAMAPDGTDTWNNPMARFLLNPFRNRTNNLTANVTMGYDIMDGLNLKTSFGYNLADQEEFSSVALASFMPYLRPYNGRSANFRFTTYNNYLIEPQLAYRRHFGAHKLDLLLGGTYQHGVSETKGILGYGQNSDAQLENLSASATFIDAQSQFQENMYNAIFARAQYSFGDRYLLNLTGRRDGSTRFGPDSRLADFWSVGAGWILSEEAWFKRNLTWISFFKLRGSYGLTGNDQIGNYSYMDLYTNAPVGVPYQQVVGLRADKIYTPGLQWEERKKLNFGADLNLLKGRLDIGVNYNRDISSNLLQRFTLPRTAGFDNVLQNFDARILNSGWEFTLMANVLPKGPLKWNLGGNITLGPRNKLLKLADSDLARISQASLFNYEVGKPISGYIRSYSYLGVNPLTGEETFEDLNGNPVQDQNVAKRGELDLNGLYMGGLQTDVSYKGITLALSLDFGNRKLSVPIGGGGLFPGTLPLNQPVGIYDLNRWRSPGDIAVSQKYTLSGGGYLYSYFSQFYEDVTYIRLNNLSASWSLPAEWTKKVGIKSGMIGLNVQNLFTLSNYSGLDPETGPAALPPTRTIALNVRASF